jgi:hypothetical protein
VGRAPPALRLVELDDAEQVAVGVSKPGGEAGGQPGNPVLGPRRLVLLEADAALPELGNLGFDVRDVNAICVRVPLDRAPERDRTNCVPSPAR